MSDLVIRNYLIDTPIDKILTQVKNELTNGKLKSINKKGGQVRVTCPHHGEGKEHNPDCYINASNDSELEYGYCHCFACGFSGRLSKFIGECFDEDEKFGEDWLIERFGNSLTDKQVVLQDIDLLQKNETQYLDETILNTMQSYHPYMDKRKLSRKVCEMFKVKYDPNTKSLVFPVYDEYNKLYMLTRRSVENKTFIIDSDKEKPVYLFNYIKEKNIREVCVCESQINALYLWSLGYPAIALFGTGTKHQYDILNSSSIKHYFLCFDGDDAGTKGIKRFIKNIRKDVFIDVCELPKGKDVNDLSLDEFDSLSILDYQDWSYVHEGKNSKIN